MPTTRPRHVITETDEVARAIDEAAKRWPEDADRRGRLLVHLVEEGRRAMLADGERHREEWHQIVRETSGGMTGLYPPDYLKQLRDEWPD